MKLMTALNTYKGEPILAGAIGYVSLSKLLQTNWLFWQDGEKPPLTKGINRDLCFDWRQQDDGDYQLTVAIEPAAMLLLTDPLLYLDTTLGTMGAFNIPVPAAGQLKKILSAPLVPAEYADEFSFKLTVEHLGLHLPAPKKVELTDVDELAPTPKLLLFGQEMDNLRYMHFMSVGFNYGKNETKGWTVSAIPPEDYSIIKTGQGLLRIKRAPPDTERQAINYLAGLSFTVAPTGTNSARELVLFSEARTIIDSATRWQNFIQNTLPELKQKGWVIEIAESFKLKFQTAQNWDAEISESRNDWFEMRFNIEFEPL